MVGTGPIIFVLETEEETAFGSSSNDLPQYAPASDTMIKCKVTRDRKSFFLISSYFIFHFFHFWKLFETFFLKKTSKGDYWRCLVIQFIKWFWMTVPRWRNRSWFWLRENEKKQKRVLILFPLRPMIYAKIRLVMSQR